MPLARCICDSRDVNWYQRWRMGYRELQLKEFARQCGAYVVGIADLTLLKGIETEPKESSGGLH